MTIEELANRFDDLVSALERIADALEKDRDAEYALLKELDSTRD